MLEYLKHFPPNSLWTHVASPEHTGSYELFRSCWNRPSIWSQRACAKAETSFLRLLPCLSWQQPWILGCSGFVRGVKHDSLHRRTSLPGIINRKSNHPREPWSCLLCRQSPIQSDSEFTIQDFCLNSFSSRQRGASPQQPGAVTATRAQPAGLVPRACSFLSCFHGLWHIYIHFSYLRLYF